MPSYSGLFSFFFYKKINVHMGGPHKTCFKYKQSRKENVKKCGKNKKLKGQIVKVIQDYLKNETKNN